MKPFPSRPRAGPGRLVGPEALDRGEALDQRAIDAEVLAAQAGRQRLADDGLEERRRSGRGSSSRWRLWVKVVASKALVPGCMSRNQRNSRSVSIRSHSWRSLRTEYRAISRRALSSRSGGTLGRPVRCRPRRTRRQPGQDAVDPPLDVAERVVGADAVLDAEHVEQWQLIVGAATHGRSPELDPGSVAQATNAIQPCVFQQPASTRAGPRSQLGLGRHRTVMSGTRIMVPSGQRMMMVLSAGGRLPALSGQRVRVSTGNPSGSGAVTEILPGWWSSSCSRTGPLEQGHGVGRPAFTTTV